MRWFRWTRRKPLPSNASTPVPAPVDRPLAEAPAPKRLADWLVDRDNNLYGKLAGGLPLTDVLARLAAAGWTARWPGGDKFTAEQEWVEVTVFADAGGVLLHGVVDPGRLDDLSEGLAWSGLSVALELYDDEGQLVRQVG